MDRRGYLTLIGSSAVALTGGTALAASQNESRADYRGDRKVVYNHDGLDLRLCADNVHLGDEVEFEASNTGDSPISLGCHNPWAIQQYSGGDWHHVTWTEARYYYMCATELGAGESFTEEVTLSESAFERDEDEDYVELHAGRHRFLLLGPAPFVALDFNIHKAG
ncbi:hypothetical protein [Halobellus ruber]|uniref:Uncharacterized protein n=1 Tax=Halobellus ruber TaxID=2761102 RepID=A0A7J9SI05_9EURY|nr:hypothetical protein [Halobellus ruber]MBB6645993.1 hypothetical protein [Halobellus ruber]